MKKVLLLLISLFWGHSFLLAQEQITKVPQEWEGVWINSDQDCFLYGRGLVIHIANYPDGMDVRLKFQEPANGKRTHYRCDNVRMENGVLKFSLEKGPGASYNDYTFLHFEITYERGALRVAYIWEYYQKTDGKLINKKTPPRKFVMYRESDEW